MPKAVPRRRNRTLTAGRGSSKQRVGGSGNRRLIVGGALLAGLGLTTALLVLLSPSPLAPDVSGRLFASREAPRTLDPEAFESIFQTRQPIRRGHWNAIFVHHSNTAGGSAASLAESARARGISGPPDHFVIGNGDGMHDGEVQFTPRWDQQAPAAAPAAGVPIKPQCISICLIGDFDDRPPTTAQRQRLAQLLAALSQHLNLRSDQVHSLDLPDSAGGIGPARLP